MGRRGRLRDWEETGVALGPKVACWSPLGLWGGVVGRECIILVLVTSAHLKEGKTEAQRGVMSLSLDRTQVTQELSV